MALGGSFMAITNAAGFYEVLNVPAGPFTVTADDPARGLTGAGAGIVELDAQTVTVDVLLVANAISLPVTRHDANNFSYTIEASGATVATGVDQFNLDVISAGTPIRFAAAGPSTQENGGREIATRNPNVAGLSVTRRYSCRATDTSFATSRF